MKLLLIEDDDMVGRATRHGLLHAQYAVDWVRSARLASKACAEQTYDAMVLDLGLPDGDGLQWLRQQRQQGNTAPTVVVTARDAVPARVDGLNAGADDYLTKPFDMSELIARLGAVLRRQHGRASTHVDVGDLHIDLNTHTVSLSGQAIALSVREFALLECLASTPGAVWSKKRLESSLYGWGQEVASNALDVHIHHLRKKLGSERIANIRGVGFQLKALP